MDFVVGCAPVYDGSSSFNHAYVLYRKCDYSVTQLQQPGELRGLTNINDEGLGGNVGINHCRDRVRGQGSPNPSVD
jgi:hypothetical protein